MWFRSVFLLFCMLVACVNASSQQNYETLRKSLVASWESNLNMDTTLAYAHRVKEAATQEFGKTSWQYLRALRDVARVYTALKDYQHARNYLLTAYNSFNAVEDAAYLKSLGAVHDMLIASYLLQLVNIDSAAFYADKQILFMKKMVGGNSRAMINNLRGIAYEFEKQAGTDQAKSYYDQALDAREVLFGKRSKEVVKGIDALLSKFKGQQLADRKMALYLVYDSAYSYQQLEKMAVSKQFKGTWDELYTTQEMVDAALKQFGDTSTTYLTALGKLGMVYEQFLGEHDIAAFCVLKSLSILEENKLQDTRSYALLLFNLADILGAAGKFQDASNTSIRYIKLAAKLSGEKSALYALANERAGLLYFNFNRYAEHYYKMASGLLVQAMLLNTSLYGGQSVNYANTLANIGHVNLKYAYYDFAVSYYLKAYKILKKTNSPELYALCRGLSAAYDAKNEAAKRNIWLQEAITIKRAMGDNNSYGLFTDLVNKTYISIELKDWPTAAKEIALLKKMVATAFTSEKKVQADLRTLVAAFELERGNVNGLEELILLNLKMYDDQEKFNRRDPDVIKAITAEYKLLANIYIRQQQFLLAKQANGEAWKLNGFDTNQVFILKQRAQIMDGLSNRDSAIYYYGQAIKRLGAAGWQDRLNYFEWKMEFATLYEKAGQLGLAETLMDEALQKIKTLMVNNMAGFSDKEKEQYNRVLQENLYRYYNLQRRLAVENPEVNGRAYHYLMQTKGLLLSAADFLAKMITASDDVSAKLRLGNLRAIRKELAEAYQQNDMAKGRVDSLEEVAVKLEQQLSFNFPAYSQFQQQNAIHLAQVQQHLKAGEALIEFVEFPYYKDGIKQDSTLYGAFLIRKDVAQPAYIALENHEMVRLLVKDQGVNGRGITQENGNSAVDTYKKLYDIVWEPISKKLANIKKLFIAADGIINNISFVSLQDQNGDFLLDKYEMHFVLGARDLISAQQEAKMLPAKVVLFGGADYNADSKVSGDALTGSRSLPAGVKGGNTWNYLPGTLNEIKQISTVMAAKKWQTVNYSGITASERNLKKLGGNAAPAILHIATHGFYFPAKKTTDTSNRDSKQDNALLRTGLLFSTANKAWLGNTVREGEEDGILTAFELGNMDLSKTKLMVLSACETGIGDNVTGEGVYGLQRAIKQAGINKMLVSLWPVPDKETAEMMQLFYKGLANSNTISAAFRGAQSAMRKRYAEKPALWAGFVLIE